MHTQIVKPQFSTESLGQYKSPPMASISDPMFVLRPLAHHHCAVEVFAACLAWSQHTESFHLLSGGDSSSRMLGLVDFPLRFLG